MRSSGGFPVPVFFAQDVSGTQSDVIQLNISV